MSKAYFFIRSFPSFCSLSCQNFFHLPFTHTSENFVAHQNIFSLSFVVDLWHLVNQQGSKALNFDLWNQQPNIYSNRNLSFLFCFLFHELLLCKSFMWIKWKLMNHLCYYKELLDRYYNPQRFAMQRWATKCWFLLFFNTSVQSWMYESLAFCF